MPAQLSAAVSAAASWVVLAGSSSASRMAAREVPLPLAALVLLACGSGFAYQLGLQQAFLDSLPERRRGQGFGLSSTGAMGGQGLTPAVTGALAAVGAGAAMAIAGAAVIAAALALRGPLTGRRTPSA